MRQSGGTIRVESEVAEGTSFRIWFPRVDGAPRAQEVAPQVALQRGTETILVVEDYASLRQLIRRMLEPAGYTVLLAGTGNEALRLIESHKGPVHLVLTDVVMPGISGLVLAARIGETHPEMRVIFTTGYTDDALLRNGINTDVERFLAKPYTKEALLDAVRTVLDAPGERPR